jgi:hypothetical protein
MEQFSGDLPFQYNFLDESLDNFYRQKENGVISLDGSVAFLFFLLSWFVWAGALAALNRTRNLASGKYWALL